MATPGVLEAVLGPDPAPFELMIEKLTSVSNDERGHAEEVYTECKKHPDLLVPKLMSSLRTCQNPTIRKLCAVLLRKSITKEQEINWKSLSPKVQNDLKSQLLQSLQQETSQPIAKQLSDVVAELAAGISDDGQWPELLPFLFQCVSSESVLLKESALLIFSQLANYIEDQLQPYLSTLKDVFKQCFESQSPEVRLAALRSTCSFVQTLQSDSDLASFQELLPGVMNTLMATFQNNDLQSVHIALEALIEVAGAEPRFLRRHLEQVVQAMLQIIETPGVDPSACHLAIEFLVSLAEARERAPGMMRKLPLLVGRLMASLIKLLETIEDDPTWHTGNTEDEDAGTSVSFEAGSEYLDRISIALGGNSILPVAAEIFPVYLNDPDWRKRHAVMTALSQIAEGCSKVMLLNIDSVVSMPLGLLGDPHPRVRWSAINAIGQLCIDLAPDVQDKHHGTVVPALVSCMDDFNNPRVQAHSAAAFLNFCEAATPDILLPYLDVSVAKIVGILQQGKRIVQESALTALAAAADCAQDRFGKYYPSVYPLLKAILVNATDKDNRMLRAKAMECISLVGMAVGREVFRNDAKEVMQVLASLENTQFDEDDPTTSYKLQAWARLCKCLGQEFLPYMQVVMPPLIRSAGLKPDVTITDADSDDDDDDEDEDDSVETITIGDKKIGIRTSVLEEKATACNMISCYADELKEGFYPWVDEIAHLMVPLLKFYFHEEVRKAAVATLPDLLRSAKLAVEKGLATGRDMSYVKQLAEYCIPPLLEVLLKEPETEIIISMLDSLNECLQVAETLLEENIVKTIIEQFKQVVESSRKRRKERAKRKESEDFDEEESEVLEEENEQENEVLDQVGEVLGTLMKTFKGALQPILHPLLPSFLSFMDGLHSSDEKRIALCVFDDVVEHLGEASFQYYDTILPIFLSASVDPFPDVRQSSTYGIGVCAQLGAEKFHPYLKDAVSKLVSVISQPDSRDPLNASASDNALSSLGKIIEFQPLPAEESSQIVPIWLTYLPVRDDKSEAKIVHAHLCSMLQRNDPRILGPGNQNVPKITSVLAEVVTSKELATEETISKMVVFLKILQSTIPNEVLTSIFANLSPDKQAALQSLLS